MPKRRKHMHLPNGYGTIRYLGGNRRNCYAVHPPSARTDENGNYIRPPAICYVDDWYVGFAVLNAWHAGTYQPGDEIRFKESRAGARPRDLDDFCRRILADHVTRTPAGQDSDMTFAQVYERYYQWKYGDGAQKHLSRQSADSTRAAYKNCAALHDKVFASIRHGDLQACINACPLRSASKENMVSLIRQMYRYALLYDICGRDYSAGLAAPAADDEHGVPFTDGELAVLWRNRHAPVVEFILIMCYSGYRISAYKTMTVNLSERYMQGGVKTAAGKNRIVPIHSAIQPLVECRIARDGCILRESVQVFRKEMHAMLAELELKNHTPHDCRHTFSRLCEKYGVNENDRKRLLGHSFGADLTNAVYGHRTLAELRAEIEKILV